MSENAALLNLIDEQKRSARYFERMTTNASNLADIRAKLGVKGRPNRVTLQRIDDLQNAAALWFAHLECTALVEDETMQQERDTWT